MDSVLLVTLNAKYVHSSLALQYLHRVLAQAGVPAKVVEFTINGNLLDMVKNILSRKPQLVAFGCYIWNIEQTLELASILKRLDPNLKVLLGGPEVSFETELPAPYIDAVITGEGELVIADTVKRLLAGESGQVVTGTPVPELDRIPSPIPGYIDTLGNRTAYYESSRGCPFNCQYCLSSTLSGVRFFSLPRVFADLQLFIEAKVKQVKFVDRTFNVTKERAIAIWQYLMEQDNGQTNFHFEIAAHLLDEECLEVLKLARPGLFQFEIGVQSTNAATLTAIQRQTNLEQLAHWTHLLKELGNIHQHLDLIVGLPYEDWASFQNSFNQVFSWQPDMLQIGFLKLLKGSGLRQQAETFALIGRERAPYEILATNWLTFDEVYALKQFEDVVEKFYNSHLCPHLLGLGLKATDAFSFFLALSRYLSDRLVVSKPERLIALLGEFLLSQGAEAAEVRDRTRWDYAVKGLPLPLELNSNQLTSQLLSDPNFVQLYLPDLAKVNFKQQLRQVVIFDSVYPVPGRYLYRLQGDIVKIEGWQDGN